MERAIQSQRSALAFLGAQVSYFPVKRIRFSTLMVSLDGINPADSEAFGAKLREEQGKLFQVILSMIEAR